LLGIQSEPYKEQEKWIENIGTSNFGEIIRFAMIETRSTDIRLREEFVDSLEKHSKTLSKNA